MTEEINYSYEGGLYAELIQNRTFRDVHTALDHWSIVQDSGGTDAISLDTTQPIADTVLQRSLKLNATHAASGHRVGIANDGYWGIPVKPATEYHASFYAKTNGASDGPLRVQIESSDGTQIYAGMDVPRIGSQWQKYTVSLTTKSNIAPTTDARFVITTEKPADYWFNLVSLFPPTFNNRPNGTRPDIMNFLSALQPAFLRFPGGNFLEGDYIATRFDWKKTIGPLEQRPGHPGCWRYGANDGMGLLEFFEWCEDLHMEPILALYAGYSLKGEHIDAGPALRPYVDDALDEIQYVTGDATTTKWGAVRAKDGHPAPFLLHYVEIGNEDFFDKSQSYDGRFTQISDAIKSRYPNLLCIATTKVTKCRPDIIDEHYYAKPYQTELESARFDKYDRGGPKIFVGEYATRAGAPTANLEAGLADAAFMTGMERNADIVILASYAPLFANVNEGGTQWTPNMVGYNGLSVYGSPSYYAQKMFATHIGDESIAGNLQNIALETFQPPTPKAKPGQPIPPTPAPIQVPTFFFVATKNTKTGAIYLKVVNTASHPQDVQISLKGVASVAPEGKLVTLTSASLNDTNSISNPEKIVPVESKASGLSTSFTETFAPYSVNVLEIDIK